jgi:CRISPR-associated protein Cas1
MSYSENAVKLRNPEVIQLSRIEDRISFLFLDRVRIEQGKTGIEAWGTEDNEYGRTQIPVASLTVLALGPGVSITTPALTTLSRSGTTVLVTSADGLVSYTSCRPLTSSSRWMGAQASLWANPATRTQVALALYGKRYPTVPKTLDIPTLRGYEGQRVKALYAQLAAQHGLSYFVRNSTNPEDSINQNLNLANSILYRFGVRVLPPLGGW